MKYREQASRRINKLQKFLSLAMTREAVCLSNMCGQRVCLEDDDYVPKVDCDDGYIILFIDQKLYTQTTSR